MTYNYNSLINDLNKTNDEVSVFILLDSSGSMSGSKWEYSIGSINSYVHTLRSKKVNADITVCIFDSNNPFKASQASNRIKLIKKATSIDSYRDITHSDIVPQGGTPLYDATAELLDLATERNNEKTVIIIMTDGEENSSVRWSLSSIKDRIKTCQERNWEIIFLGAEFNIESIAKDYGLDSTKVLNTSSYVNLRDSMNFYADSTVSYMSGSSINTTAIKTTIS